VSALRQSVTEALGSVFDPCSLAAGAPLSVIDMGLITELTIDDEAGVVAIAMRPTSAMCTVIAGVMTDVEEIVARVPGVSSVRVSLHNDTMWTEANLSENGRRVLEARRQRSRTEVPVRPHEWKTRRSPSLA
jgi:metal-sulfur cluster biosynthetic enzyme